MFILPLNNNMDKGLETDIERLFSNSINTKKTFIKIIND